MTTTDLQQDTFVGIRAVYEDAQYVLGLVADYFTSLSSAWAACAELALFGSPSSLRSFVLDEWTPGARRSLEDNPEPARRRLSPGDPVQEEKQLFELNTYMREARATGHLQEALEASHKAMHIYIEREKRKELAVSQLRIESPMEITLAVVESGGIFGISAYGIHLLRQVLCDPDRIGSWLPKLRESWHRGMANAESARYEREQIERRRPRTQPAADQLMEAAQGLIVFRALDVETIGAGDPPDDLVTAIDDLNDEGPTEADS